MKVTIQIDGLPSLRSIRSALPATLPSLPRLVGPIVVALSLILSSFSVAAVLSAPRYATVGVPSTVGFEGFLAQTNGQPIPNGTYQLTFRVFGVETGGSALWTESLTGVQVTNGLYSVRLGATAPFTSTTFDGDRWVGVTVDGGSEITPRTRVSSVPFALNADNANRIGGGGTANMVVAFDGPCPSGWTEFTQAQGRTIVGVPENGTLGGIPLGSTPLGDREDRALPQHSHYVNTQGSYSSNNYLSGLLYTSASASVIVAVNNQVTTTNASVGSTSNVIPYIQLRYCKLSP